MQHGADPADPGDPRRLATEAERTVDRLRSLPLTRLTRPLASGSTPADRARALAQDLVDRTVALTGGAARPLPPIPDTAAGDALAVCAHDLVDAVAQSVHPDADATARWATAALIDLRQAL